MGEVPRLKNGLSPPIDLMVRFLFGSDTYQKHCIISGWGVAYHLGSGYCRQINNGSNDPNRPYSQHAFAGGDDDGGNAIDIGLPDTAEGHRVGDEIAALARKHPELYDQVLWRGVPLHFPGHVHLSGAPMGSGVPMCDGGPNCPIAHPLPLTLLGGEEDDVANAAEKFIFNELIQEAAELHAAGKLVGYGGSTDWPETYDEYEDKPSKWKGLAHAIARSKIKLLLGT